MIFMLFDAVKITHSRPKHSVENMLLPWTFFFLEFNYFFTSSFHRAGVYRQQQCNLNSFVFHFYSLLLKPFVRSYFRPVFHSISQTMSPDSVCTFRCFYLLLRPQQVYFTLWCSESQTCSFHHFSSVICNTLRCLRANWGFKKAFFLFPTGLGDC